MLEIQKSVTLKLQEPVVNPEHPWADDLLNRSEIATRLTNLIATQTPPLSISLDGEWGTGKSFLLLRWKEQLRKEGFEAIYFNAWEDDFCDDPLLAILGQIQETFKEDRLKALMQQVTRTGLKLAKRNLISVAEKHTGLSLQPDEERNLLDEYTDQRATKEELKGNLTRLAGQVFNRTSHPLVFIIDELDRCRPTFAIEMLERVKHIFDVPHLMFIFGINRDELSKSISSVYGPIQADIYLRRFFDFEFHLPRRDTQNIARGLIERFNLAQTFQALAESSKNPIHMHDYDNYVTVFPAFWSALGLSLRDIEHSVRLLALVTKNVAPGSFTNPFILGLLIALRFKKEELYAQIIAGDFSTSEVMDYISGEINEAIANSALASQLDRTEGFLYCYDIYSYENAHPGQEASRTGSSQGARSGRLGALQAHS